MRQHEDERLPHDPEERINPGHRETRDKLRVFGPPLMIVGLIVGAVGFIGFIPMGMRYGPFGAIGFMVLFGGGAFLAQIGFVLTKFGYMGAVARYMAQEGAPVGRDTFNYMADGTRDSVRDLASAVGEGLRGDAKASRESIIRCPQCGTPGDADMNFCGRCGTPFASKKETTCSSCGRRVDAESRFCGHCGRPMPPIS